MDPFAFPPFAAVLDGASRLLTALGGSLDVVAPHNGAALAVVLVTLLVRAALIPVGVSLRRAEIVRTRLAPALRDLQRRYGRNPDLLRRKTLELYTREKTSPAAGCLPLLVQAPVVSIVYAVFVVPTIAGSPNALLAEELLGVPLGATLVAHPPVWPLLLVPVVLLVVLAVVATLTRRAALRHPTQAPEPGSQAERMQHMLSWLPYATVVIAAFVPLAAVLYLAVSTTWSLIERATLRRMLS